MINELRIGNFQINTIDVLDINITKEIYDIQDPNKSKTDFSKTVTIAGSKANDEVFAALFDVNFNITNDEQLQPFFNPTKKVSCVYIQDTLPLIEGYCQLNEIVVLKNNKVNYNITISGKKRDFFSKINNRKLADLDLGNSTYNDTGIRAEWTSPSYGGSALYYPLINRDLDGTSAAVNWARIFGYNCFYPFIYVKRLWDKIFEEAETIYQSTFVTSTYFEKLILECDQRNFQVDQTAVANAAVNATRTTAQTITPVANNQTNNLSNYWSKNIIFNNEITDPSLQYDTATGTFTATVGGYTNFNCMASGYINRVISTGINVTLDIILIRKRGTIYDTLAITSGAYTSPPSSQIILDVVVNLNNIFLNIGDEVRLCIGNIREGGAISNNSWSWTNDDAILGRRISYFQAGINGAITYGQTFNINSTMYDMTQKDFIMGLVKMFNLYMEVDNLGRVIIEPRDTFFTNDVIDLTYKLDVSKDFKIQPNRLLEHKRLEFDYTANQDYLSKSFISDTGEVHGYFNIDFDNDFKKEIKKVEVPFCLPPLRNKVAGVKMELTQEDNDITLLTSQKPIIAFAKKQVPGTQWYYLDSSAATISYTSYPYAGHLDDPLNPTYDLCFGRQKLYYFKTPNTNGLKLPNFNLYNQFHATQWTEIGDKNSKQIECFINLNAYDISTLTFRPLYFIRDAYYRLLSVNDYNPQGKDTTLCRFLKLQTATPISNSLIETEGSEGDVKGNEIGWKTHNIDTKGTGRGYNTNGAVVVGNGNGLGDNVGAVVVNGDSNIINSDVRNVVIFNSNNNLVTESNKLILGYNYLEISDDLEILGNEGSPLFIFADNDLAGGDITITLPDETLNLGKYYVINKIKSTHQVIIKQHDGTTLDTLTSIDTAEYLIT